MMTVADRLRQQGAALHQQAAELVRLADELDRAAPMPAPGREFFLNTHKATKLAQKSSSWVYANARRFDFGWKLPSGSWAFSEQRLRAFLIGRASECEKSELCEKSDVPPLSISPKSWHG